MKVMCLISVLLSNLALADAIPGGAAQGITPLIPLIVIFGIFYFLMIRPQQKKAKLHEKFLTELKRGDMVVTSSGIIGTVKTISDKFVTLEVDEGVCLKLLKNTILESANSLKDEAKVKALQPQEIKEENQQTEEQLAALRKQLRAIQDEKAGENKEVRNTTTPLQPEQKVPLQPKIIQFPQSHPQIPERSTNDALPYAA